MAGATLRKTPTLLREPVYMVDFSVFKPDDDLQIRIEECGERAWKWKHPDGEPMCEEVHSFTKKVFERSGIDTNGSYLPKNLHPMHTLDPQGTLNEGFAEARLIMGGTVRDVLNKTGLTAQDIDILVTSSSIFCPTPSVASMLINMFGMREDVQAYSLGGMGCGNGTIGIQVVRDLLQAHPGANALFVTSEICSTAFYRGKDKHCLVSNAIFRMGGAAALLTSGTAQRGRAKYQLTHSERIHTGARESSYNCMYVGPDDAGHNGIFLYKDLPTEAGLALEKCLKKITPQIMTWSQYAEAAYAIGKRKLLGKDAPLYVHDFTRCVDRFLLHAGGYAVLKGIQAGMRLPAEKMMPSFSNLKDYGNTSSSTTWYSWAYEETVGDIKAGEVLMQAGVGGGMKAGVNIWRAMRDINHDAHPAWAHLNGRPYTEADLPRPITRKEDVGTLTGFKEFDAKQGDVKHTNWGVKAGKGMANGVNGVSKDDGDDALVGRRDQQLDDAVAML